MSVRRARPSSAQPSPATLTAPAPLAGAATPTSTAILAGAAILLGPVILLATAVRRPRRRSDRVDTAASTVPDLIGRDVARVDKLAGDAGVVPILSYRPRARQAPGTVVAVHPAAGSAVRRGSTIQVSVAGRPTADLDGRVAADRRRFVGLGADPDGTVVVAVAAGVDPAAAVSAIRPALAGRKHRVVACP